MNIINARFATHLQCFLVVVIGLTNISKFGNAPNVERILRVYIGLNITAEK